jgi:hypothetical protein
MTSDAARQADETIGIGGCCELLDEFALVAQQTDVDPLATEIQSGVQHEDGPPLVAGSRWTLGSVSPRRPSFIAVSKPNSTRC